MPIPIEGFGRGLIGCMSIFPHPRIVPKLISGHGMFLCGQKFFARSQITVYVSGCLLLTLGCVVWGRYYLSVGCRLWVIDSAFARLIALGVQFTLFLRFSNRHHSSVYC